MEFTLSAKTSEYAAKLQAFMEAEVFPAEAVYEHQRAELKLQVNLMGCQLLLKS
mgnify:CR=1 FL=1